MLTLSIVVPCYNEKNNLPLLLTRFGEALEGAQDVELVLVDNGSTDGSAEVFSRLLPQYPFARLVTVTENQGYGYGILAGLAAAHGDFLGWTHADLQTDPSDVMRAWEIIKDAGGGDQLFVKGDRKGRPLFDEFFTFGMSVFETLYMGKRLYEINAQPNLFSRQFYQTWQRPPHDFALDLYVLCLASAQNLDIRRIPVRFPERLHGESKWNTGLLAKWKFICRTISFSRKLKRSGVI